MHDIDLSADEVTNAQLDALNFSRRRELRQYLTRSYEWVRTSSGWRRRGTTPEQPIAQEEPQQIVDVETQTETVTEDQEQGTETEVPDEAPKPKRTPRKKTKPKSDAETGSSD